MPSIVALSIIVLGSAIFSITLVVVCGKRKLYQRKECSRRGAHIPGQEAKKTLRREIERRIDRVSDIVYEPKLTPLDSDCEFPPYYHRMKVVDNMKYLGEELSKLDGVQPKSPRESIRSFLVNLTSPGLILSFVEPRLIHELCDQYDHARHHPATFDIEAFTAFHSLFIKILHSARRKVKSSAKSSGGHASSDHDSAIDDPEQSGDDENLLGCESSMVILHRPHTLKTDEKDNFETSV